MSNLQNYATYGKDWGPVYQIECRGLQYWGSKLNYEFESLKNFTTTALNDLVSQHIIELNYILLDLK